MRIGKSRLNLTAGIRLSKNIFFGDGISGALAGRGIFGTTSQALAISPQFAQGAATFGTTSAAQLPYLAQAANTFGTTSSATASSAIFLLDDYPNAAAAYSIRLLSSSYSGALVRIRKDTGGQPEKDFYPDSNNELSLNSGDGGGTTLGSWIGSNDGYVVTWYDQSGNSRDASQSTTSQQAKILSGGAFITVNGKPALDFTIDNTQEVASSIPSSSDYSLFSVFSSSDTQAIPYNNTPNGTGNYFSWWQNGSSSNPNSGVGTPSYYYDSLLINPANTQTLYDNYATGNQEFQQVVSLDFSSWSNFVFGGWGSSGYAFTGYFQEIVLYDSDQTSNISGIYNNQIDFF